MSKTKIEWTEQTWNPVRGCTRVSEGCRNCYAERMAERFCWGVEPKDVPPGAVAAPNDPFYGFAERTPSGPRWTGRVELIESQLDIPLRRRKPTTYFVNSMSDLFHESLPDEAIDRVFAMMALCPQHQFQVLTKRAQRMKFWFTERESRFGPFSRKWGAEEIKKSPRDKVWAEACRIANVKTVFDLTVQTAWPLPNVWLGVSCEDQKTADERISLLLQTPAAVRFVSLEPLLGPIGIIPFLRPSWQTVNPEWEETRRLNWVIVGGESGPGARACDVWWVRSIVRQCAASSVPCFVKQLGANVIDRNDAGFEGDTPTSWPMDTAWSELDSGYQGAPVRVLLDDRKGGDPLEWPEDLRVRQMPDFYEIRRET